MEWQAILPAGKGRLIVHFTGGSITAYGVTPATYKTDNPAQQAIIETSNHFRTGRIFLVKAELLKEVNTPAAAPAAAPAPVVETATVEAPSAAAAIEETQPVPGTVPAAAPAASPATVVENETDGDETPETGGAEEVGTDESGFKIVKASCFEDVRQYLIKNYGFTPSAVRTKALAKAKATANKVKFLIDGKELA